MSSAMSLPSRLLRRASIFSVSMSSQPIFSRRDLTSFWEGLLFPATPRSKTAATYFIFCTPYQYEQGRDKQK